MINEKPFLKASNISLSHYLADCNNLWNIALTIFLLFLRRMLSFLQLSQTEITSILVSSWLFRNSSEGHSSRHKIFVSLKQLF